MNEERRMVLQMLEQGQINADEAGELLRALGEVPPDEAGDGAADATNSTAHAPEREPQRHERPGGWTDGFEDLSERLEDSLEGVSKRLEERMEGIPDLVEHHIRKARHSGGLVFNLFDGPSDTTEWRQSMEGLERVELDVDTRNGHVEVVGHEGDELYVRLEKQVGDTFLGIRFGSDGGEELVRQLGNVGWDGRRLRVEPGPAGRRSHRWRMHVFVEVPRRLLVSGRAETTNGRVLLRGLSGDGALRAISSNGRIEMQDVRGGDWRLSTTNGRLQLVGVDAAVRGHTTNGRVEWQMGSITANRDVWLETTNGPLRLGVPAAAGLDLDVQTTHGSLKTHLARFGETAHGDAKRRVCGERPGTPLLRLQASTTNGSVTIRDEVDTEERTENANGQ